MAASGAMGFRVEALTSLDAARPVFQALADRGGFYQSEAFVEAWLARRGAGATPFLITVWDGAGRALALLPLYLCAWGPWRVARFIGGADSNLNVPLRHPDFAPDATALRHILRAAQKSARPSPLFFALDNMPAQWRGAPTLLAADFCCASADPYFSVALSGSWDEFQLRRLSGPARKKLRAKQKRLALLGPLTHVRPATPEAREAALAAYFGFQRDALEYLATATTEPSLAPFYRRLAQRPEFEIHVLAVGVRPVAIFGAGRASDVLQGQFIGYDRAADVASCSPGEILLNLVISDAFARGLRCFSLGLGEARYKRQWCEAEHLAMFYHAPNFLVNLWLRPLMISLTAARRALKKRPKILNLTRRLILLVKKARKGWF